MCNKILKHPNSYCIYTLFYLIVIIEIKFQNDIEGDTYVANAAVVGVSVEFGIHRYLMVAGAGAVPIALLLCSVRTLNIRARIRDHPDVQHPSETLAG